MNIININVCYHDLETFVIEFTSFKVNELKRDLIISKYKF